MDHAAYEVGYDIPAALGMSEAEIETPCLILDLEALERNLVKMGRLAQEMGVALRVHGKMHKSVDVALLQQRIGGACGLCCQKVSEAEAFVRGGIRDVLISNQVRGAAKVDRLARLPLRGAKVAVCVDDMDGVAELAAAVQRHGTQITCLVEIDCGAGRCGVIDPGAAVALAQAIDAAPGLHFGGVQAYQGSMQHLEHFSARAAAFDAVMVQLRAVLAALEAAGLPCATITGGGTGSFMLEGQSGVYTEIQCGSYAFMDADYGRVLDAEGRRLDHAMFENALFLLTSVMSHVRMDQAVVDAGLKSQSVDSGLPVVFGRDDVIYTKCTDEHGVVHDPQGVLRVGDRLRLVPGHCDPTCNLHDWYVGLRGGVVAELWPVSARGKAF